TPSPDEAKVYKALRICLEMRDIYVFRETIAPFTSEASSGGSTRNWIFNNKEHGKASADARLAILVFCSI
nr:AMP deaminase-like [Tanacetum cinerariifolium]GFB45227.1 AMP deaminase-like [Tanacetum cinerariifolium]